jgi:hypothetical protein
MISGSPGQGLFRRSRQAGAVDELGRAENDFAADGARALLECKADDQVDRATQHGRQILLHLRVVEQPPRRFVAEGHEHVDSAVGPEVVAQDRANSASSRRCQCWQNCTIVSAKQLALPGAGSGSSPALQCAANRRTSLPFSTTRPGSVYFAALRRPHRCLARATAKRHRGAYTIAERQALRLTPDAPPITPLEADHSDRQQCQDADSGQWQAA